MSTDALAVGAWLEDSAAVGVGGDQSDDTAVNAGAAYVFARDESGNWSQLAYVKASDTETEDHFGYSIAVSDDALAVGAPAEGEAGAVYVFQ